MQIIKLNNHELHYLVNNYPRLYYNHSKNMIVGPLEFELEFENVYINDTFQIAILLDNVSEKGLPVVKETNNRILNIAKKKKISTSDMHLNSLDGELCLIIPPEIKSKYPNGFNLTTLLHHIEEHLYWVSYYEKYDSKPWNDYGHGKKGYLEWYLNDPKNNKDEFMKYLGCKNNYSFKRKLKEMHGK